MECQYFFLRFYVLSVDDSLLIAGSIENILKNNQNLSNKVLRLALFLKNRLCDLGCLGLVGQFRIHEFIVSFIKKLIGI